MEEELANDDAVAREVALKATDVLKAFFPNVLRDQAGWKLLPREKLRMHAHNQRFLVIAAIENANAAALRQTFHATPQVIVVQVFAGGGLEGIDLAALRIDARHDMLDHTVLSGRVHRLKNKQHSPAILCVEHVLQFGKQLDTARK